MQLRASRKTSRTKSARSEYTFVMSVERALRTHKEKAHFSILKEMQSMHDKKLFRGVKLEAITKGIGHKEQHAS